MVEFNYQENINTDPDAYNALVRLLAGYLVHYDLDDLCHEDKKKAFELLRQKMVEDEIPFETYPVVVVGFENEYKKILEKIESLNYDSNEEMLMLLVYIVRFFESIVNEHIHTELGRMGFTQSEKRQILRKFSIDEKLGWFLKILSGTDYTKEKSKNWSLLKNYITTRNFYIHYEPSTFEALENHIMKLNKESFSSFMESCKDCYYFLEEHHSKEVKDFNERMQDLIDYIINQDRYQFGLNCNLSE